MNIIELTDLQYRWPKQANLTLDIPTFSVAQQEKVFIKGPSGSGKSTLLSLLTGIVTPSNGKIKLLQQDLTALSSNQRDKFRANHIGYIFQQFNLLPYLSVIDNVLLPCHFSPQRKQKAGPDLAQEAKRLLTQLHLPSSCLDRPVTELSIGQQQRVAAARALIGKPDLLIADEPTSALDHDNRTAFIELLMQECHAANISLVFVSHDPTLESLFDRGVDLAKINIAEGEWQC